MLVTAWSLTITQFFFLSLTAFVVGAFISATYDIAADGYYMLALTEKEQAFFVGLRSGFYRLAMIFGSGLLVYLAGRIEVISGNIPFSWTTVLAASGATGEGWNLCAAQTCREIGALPGEPVELSACASEGSGQPR